MRTTRDASMLDGEVLDEIELTSRLMIAASGCSEHLTEDEVDRILGVHTGF